jgi:hypothetical protein
MKRASQAESPPIPLPPFERPYPRRSEKVYRCQFPLAVYDWKATRQQSARVHLGITSSSHVDQSNRLINRLPARFSLNPFASPPLREYAGQIESGEDEIYRASLLRRCGRSEEQAWRIPSMAEGVGFEPTDPYGSPVFKTGALNRSAIPPHSACRPSSMALHRL